MKKIIEDAQACFESHGHKLLKSELFRIIGVLFLGRTMNDPS